MSKKTKKFLITTETHELLCIRRPSDEPENEGILKPGILELINLDRIQNLSKNFETNEIEGDQPDQTND